MTYQQKKVVVDALIGIASSSPTKKFLSNGYLQPSGKLEISAQEFNIWIKYIESILDTLYEFIPLNTLLITKIEIVNIATQSNVSYLDQALEIERKILNLAQGIAAST